MIVASKLPSTTIKDFGGGWNTSDSDLNLNSRFQPISDNIVRGIDGSFSPRQGYALWANFGTADVTDLGTISANFATVDESPMITMTFPAVHGLSSGDHVTISGLIADVGGIPFEEINGTHSVLVVDTTTITFNVREAATATQNDDIDVDVVTDDHLIGGNIIHEQYFNRRLICFTDTGEVGTITEDGTLARIWGAAEAEADTAGLVPTRRTEHWSSDAFKSTVVACNGRDRDKPIQIDEDFNVEFLVDKATSSNSAVPRADYVICTQGYVIFICTEFGDPYVEFSAKGTDGTFTRDANPADSVEVDLSMVTSSIEPILLGAAPIRDKLYTAFYDKGMIGTIGVYDGTDHVPDFNDTISENGTVSHRTMISLGNDILMCDYAGVPSVAISQQSGIYMPIRLSELIAPSIQSHLSSLSEDTLRDKAYAVFNRSDRTYMLFLPIYDEVVQTLTENPIQFNEQLAALNYCIMYAPNHKLFENSYITVAGATGIGSVDAADINGVRKVINIVSPNAIVVELGDAPASADDTSGGGSSVTITPINDETIGYIFEYNKEFKIRRWTRYRGMNFDCAASSQRGKVFFAKGKKVYRFGDNERRIHADFVDDYDYYTWTTSTDYVSGDRVRDSDTGVVWYATKDYTSASSGTFEEDRDAATDVWEEYKGEPIVWALETPWSDMRDRGGFKSIHYVNVDSEGYGRINLSAFVNKLRINPATYIITPYRTLEFQAGDTGGWNSANPQVWGSGRRTREEKVWPMRVRGKLIRWRFDGETREPVKITSLTMYYRIGNK